MASLLYTQWPVCVIYINCALFGTQSLDMHLNIVHYFPCIRGDCAIGVYRGGREDRMFTNHLTFNPLSSLLLSLHTVLSCCSFCGECADKYKTGAETLSPFSSVPPYLNITLTPPPTPSHWKVVSYALLYLTSIKYNITMIMFTEQSTHTPIHPLRALYRIVPLFTMDILPYSTVPMSVPCIPITPMSLIIPCDMCSSSSSSISISSSSC